MALGPLIILSYIFGKAILSESLFFDVFQLVLFLSIAPGYFILPGIFKAIKNNKSVKYFELQLFMGFTIITLGIGPSIIYYYLYDPIIKKMIKNLSKE